MQRNQERGGGADIDVVVTCVHNAYGICLYLERKMAVQNSFFIQLYEQKNIQGMTRLLGHQ